MTAKLTSIWSTRDTFDSRLTTNDSRLTTHDSLRDSRLTTHDSRRDGRLTSHFLLLTLLILTGCGAASEETVVIDFWGLGVEGETVKQLVPEFERENPGIRVRVQQIPWRAAHEKLLTAFVGEGTPDVCQLGNTWIPEFAALRALAPLDSLAEASEAVDRVDYFDGIWRTNVVDGVTYGIPWYVDTRLLFYRKDLLRNAGYDSMPETWDEWIEAMQAVKRQAGEDRFVILLPTNEWQHPVLFGLQTGASLLKDNGRYADFSSHEFREGFEFYVDLFKNRLAPATSNTQISNVHQEFARGYISMYLSGPWQIGEFIRRMPPDLKDEWMTAAMPGPDSAGVSLAGGASLVVFERSRNKEAAWKFVEFLSRPEQQVRFYRATGNLPPSRSAWQDSLLASNEYAAAFYEQLQRVTPLPPVPEWERIADKVWVYAEEAIRGRMTIDEALGSLDREVDEILAKRRWMLARREHPGSRLQVPGSRIQVPGSRGADVDTISYPPTPQQP
ncbi:MAG TPA: sugar ABC transporter substrate-binding protein [Rhodothermales bacterium]|nr:sugar ABC transporter substrate-binding protein [Rhodothermales bacterium]